MPSPPPPRTLTLRSTLTPPSAARTWQSVPHPTLPLLATASSDKTVRVYSLTSFTLLNTISGGHKRSVRSVAWKPNTSVSGESVLATGSFDASSGIWRRWDQDAVPQDFTRGEDESEDEDEYRFAVLLDGPSSEIKSVAWNAGGQFLATSSRDKSVWVWEELEDDNFETVGVLNQHEGDVKCVAWHPQEDLLASASYDDTVRLWKEDIDDWACVATLGGWDGTVWWVDFEGVDIALKASEEDTEGKQDKWIKRREAAGPRLVASSDDLSIRVWRRKPKENSQKPQSKWGMPSILKSGSIEEDWVEEARLPQIHDRAIYAAAWSRRTGLIVSAGSDGRIVVYEEKWVEAPAPSSEAQENQEQEGEDIASTQWVISAEIEAAHDVYEINHVCWARRCDQDKRSEDEEAIISTGDDGEVRVWVLD